MLLMAFQRDDKRAQGKSHTDTMPTTSNQAKGTRLEEPMLGVAVVAVAAAVAALAEVSVVVSVAEAVEAVAQLSISLRHRCQEVSPHSTNGNSK